MTAQNPHTDDTSATVLAEMKDRIDAAAVERRISPDLKQHVRNVVASMSGNASALARMAGVSPSSVTRFCDPAVDQMEGPTIGKIVNAADLVSPRRRTITHIHGPVTLDDMTRSLGDPQWPASTTMRGESGTTPWESQRIYRDPPAPTITKISPSGAAPNPPPPMSPPSVDPAPAGPTQRCRICGKDKPATHEFFHHENKGGPELRTECRACVVDYQKRYDAGWRRTRDRIWYRKGEKPPRDVPRFDVGPKLDIDEAVIASAFQRYLEQHAPPPTPSPAIDPTDRPIIHPAPPVEPPLDRIELNAILAEFDALQDRAFDIAASLELLGKRLFAALHPKA